MKGILRLVFKVSTCMLKPGNRVLKPVPSVANDSQELQHNPASQQRQCSFLCTELVPLSNGALNTV